MGPILHEAPTFGDATWRAAGRRPTVRGMNRLAFGLLRLALSCAVLIAWCLAGRALAPPRPAVSIFSVILVAAAIGVGIGLDLTALAASGRWAEERRVWRAAVSVGALLGTAMVFPPVSVPSDSPFALLFGLSAVLIAVGVAWDIFAVALAGTGDRSPT